MIVFMGISLSAAALSLSINGGPDVYRCTFMGLSVVCLCSNEIVKAINGKQ